MGDTATLPANGAVISTDEVTRGGTAQHVQFVKLMDGTENSAAQIPGDATNGLDVDVTRLPHGTKTVSRTSITTAVTLILAAKASRVSAVLYNAGPSDIYVSASNAVSTSTGFLFPVGATFADDASNDAWYGVTASGTATIHALEV